LLGNTWRTNLGCCVLNHLLICHIALVANEQLVDTFGSISVDLLEPLLHVVEGVHIRDIVHDADAMGTAVIGTSDGSEAFLAGGIPLEAKPLALANMTTLSPSHPWVQRNSSQDSQSEASLSCRPVLWFGFSVVPSQYCPSSLFITACGKACGVESETYEVDTDRRYVGFGVGIICEPQ